MKLEKERDRFERAVERSIVTDNWDWLDDWKSQNCTFQFNSPPIERPPGHLAYSVEAIRRALVDPRFLRANGCGDLLLILLYEWAHVNAGQKEDLLPALEGALAGLSHSGALYVVAELLGRNYCSRESLQALKRLRETAGPTQRAFIPVGLRYLIEDASEPSLASGAYRELSEMREDPSEEVRSEVEDALATLAAQGRHVLPA